MEPDSVHDVDERSHAHGIVRGVSDTVWPLRHLRDLRRIDWSDPSHDWDLIDTLERAFAGLYDHYFRMEVRDWGNVSRGRVIVVGNHSGFGVAELLMLLVAWHRRFGRERPAYVLAHPWLYKTPFLRVVVPKLGGVPATWESGRRVLDHDGVLFIFPGAEDESTRPFSERYRVNLHGHRGFVRLALATETPVVPCVTIGSHATMLLPPGMHALAAVTGARRFLGLNAVPMPLQLWIWIASAIAFDHGTISGPLATLLFLATPPLYPSKITTVFDEPIPPAAFRGVTPPGEDAPTAGCRYVERLMQDTMDRLAAERHGVFG